MVTTVSRGIVDLSCGVQCFDKQLLQADLTGVCLHLNVNTV